MSGYRLTIVGSAIACNKGASANHHQLASGRLAARFAALEQVRDEAQRKLDLHLPEVKARALEQAGLIAETVCTIARADAAEWSGTT